MISSLKSGSIIHLNPNVHPFDVYMPFDKDSDFIKKLESFLDEGNDNYSRPTSSIDIYSRYKTIFEPLSINQRVKNQQGVLMFSNIIGEVDYLNSSFSEKNTIRKLTDIYSKEFKRSFGFFKINISGEYKNSIRRELNSYGFTKEFIYPELMSFTESMQEKIVAGRIK